MYKIKKQQMNIPINIETLLTANIVESERIEFKKGWNPKRLMRTVAAFVAQDNQGKSVEDDRKSVEDNSLIFNNNVSFGEKSVEDNQESVYDRICKSVYDKNHKPTNTDKKIINRIIIILKYCMEPKTRAEILSNLGLSVHTKNYERNIDPAINARYLEMTIPDIPNSSKQKYITTKKGKEILDIGHE